MNKSKYLEISGGKRTRLDAEDFAWASSFRWQHSHGYACRRERQADGKLKKVYLHSVIAQTPKGQVTDHINGDSLDNRRSNLQVCSHRENIWKANRKPKGRSKFLGVTYNKSEKNWTARSEHNKKIVIIGRFPTAKKAAFAYDGFIRKNRGPFARTNFKPEAMKQGIVK